jgi:hypothetical protein
MKDGKVAGTLASKRGDANATSTPIADMVLDGNKLMFAVTTLVFGREATATSQGVVSENGISRWVLTDFNGQPRDTAWTAKRSK